MARIDKGPCTSTNKAHKGFDMEIWLPLRHSLPPDHHKGLPWHSSQLNWLIVGAGASGVVLELVSHNDWAWDALTFRETFTAWQLAGVTITIERSSVTDKQFYKH